jgi:hypothetical protein
MYAKRIFMCLIAGGLFWAVSGGDPSTSLAQGSSYPYYSQWTYNTDHNYYYCNYTYAQPQDSYHRVYYYPTQYYPNTYYSGRRYAYYYNWSTRRHWGRMDLETGKYSMLPEDKRKEKLTDIAEKDFPVAVARDTITIPGAEKEGLKMKDLPPALPKDKAK